MISGVNQYQIYATLLKNPMGPADSNPYANAIYNAGITAMYSSRLNTKLKSELDTFMGSLANNLTKLQSNANKLTATSANKQNPVLNSKKVTAANTNIATAEAQGTATVATYKLGVTNLAKSQSNETNKVGAAAQNNFTTGTNTFKLTVGGKATNINVNINANQSNRDVLKEISSKINQANTGVTSIYKEDKNGNGYLQINAKDTGIANKFEINDVNGDLAQKAGLGNISQAAEDARYNLNGKELTSGSNTVNIDDNKVAVTLKAAGETTLKVGTDTEKVTSAIKDFVNSYNELQKGIRSAGSYASTKATQLSTTLAAAVKNNLGGLESIGIRVSPNGTMRIEKNLLENAVTNNIEQVKNVFANTKGVASEINKATSEAMLNPLKDYINNLQVPETNTGNVSNQNYYNSYATKSYLIKSMSQGIMFDMQT